MKKTLLIFLCCLFSVVLQAQTEHLNFMGIPLDGKIKAFNKELQKKGFVLDELAGKMLDGTYIYNGIFAGERAQVFVNYDRKTKVVYCAAAIIKCYSKEQALGKYENMYDMLEEKYSHDEGVMFIENAYKKLKEHYGDTLEDRGVAPFEWKKREIEDDYEVATFIIPNVEKGIKGDIRLFISESYSNITHSTEYNLFVKYSDWQNDDSARDNRMDDL